MKVVIHPAPFREILRWSQRILFTGAVSTLAYCGFVLTDAWLFQARANQQLSVARDTSALGPTVIGPDGLIGRIEIPRLDLSVVVVEGVGKKTLRRAVGHIPKTALPGQLGNVGISGHRDTYFRHLKDIRTSDLITLATSGGDYNYRVVSTKIVSPDDIAVLDSSGTEILTLVTCYPFYYVGSAPHRFIVRAERVL